MMLGRRALLLGAANAAAPCAAAQPFGDAMLGPLTGRAPGGVAGNQGPRGPASPPPTLDLNFMTGPPLDPRLTFTRASTATYFDSSGTMRTAASDAPRFDYDPVTHVVRGLLIEEQRTNLNFPSTGFSSGWSFVATILGPGIAGAPDGTATVARIAETAVTSAFYMAQLPTIAASTAYTLSVHAKAAENRYLQVALDDGNTNGAHATFDVQAGVVSGPLTAHGTGVIGTASIRSIGNGFYRCAITTTIGAATTGRTLFALSNTASPGFAPGYAGNAANGLLIWGAQLEQGAFATSYIPTTAAAVTRSVDQCSMPIGPWFDQTKGSLTYEYILEGSPPSYGGPVMIAGANSATDHIVPDRLDAGGSATAPTTSSAVVSAGGTINGYADYAPGLPITAGLIHRGAIAWTTNAAVAAAHDGVLGTSIGATTALPVITTLAIAGSTTGQPIISQWARRTRYWPRVLSNSELQSVTT